MIDIRDKRRQTFQFKIDSPELTNQRLLSVSRARPFTSRVLTEMNEGRLGGGSSFNMAAKALRQRSRRDANNVNGSTDSRTSKEEKGGEDSKDSETRQE